MVRQRKVFERKKSCLVISAVVVAFLTFLYTPAFSQMSPQTVPQEQGAVKVIEFMDGSVVTGKMVEMNIETVRIETKEGPVITRKFKDIKYIYSEQEYAKMQKPLMFFPEHSWELGAEVSWIKYEEPNLMEEKGFMYGIIGSYTYHHYAMIKIEGRFAYGQVDYSSPISGEIDGIEDYLVELRALLGYDYPVGDRGMLTPYIGIGYRYLKDNAGGEVSTIGAQGYDRESYYYYTPIGLTGVVKVGMGWSLGATAEYDYFWRGKQKSHLGDVNPIAPTIENKQGDGYGLRGSISVRKQFEAMAFNLEPYIRYWDIDNSDLAYGIWYEPDNKSTEFGCRLSVIF